MTSGSVWTRRHRSACSRRARAGTCSGLECRRGRACSWMLGTTTRRCASSSRPPSSTWTRRTTCSFTTAASPPSSTSGCRRRRGLYGPTAPSRASATPSASRSGPEPFARALEQPAPAPRGRLGRPLAQRALRPFGSRSTSQRCSPEPRTLTVSRPAWPVPGCASRPRRATATACSAPSPTRCTARRSCTRAAGRPPWTTLRPTASGCAGSWRTATRALRPTSGRWPATPCGAGSPSSSPFTSSTAGPSRCGAARPGRRAPVSSCGTQERRSRGWSRCGCHTTGGGTTTPSWGLAPPARCWTRRRPEGRRRPPSLPHARAPLALWRAPWAPAASEPVRRAPAAPLRRRPPRPPRRLRPRRARLVQTAMQSSSLRCRPADSRSRRA
mmetsp:Transcript_8098/g.31906  ORF Transcript_8098/g.31906 Transcript_8098/m.31906 type:complete len:385 (-) Transcript_8098:946-2100(-)